MVCTLLCSLGLTIIALGIAVHRNKDNNMGELISVCPVSPLNFLLLGGLDASSIGERVKQVAVLLYGFSFMSYAIRTKSFWENKPEWKEPVEMFIWSITPLAIWQMGCTSLSIFCVKYFCRFFVFGDDAVILPCPTRVQLERIDAAPPSDGKEATVWVPASDFNTPKYYELVT